MRVSPCHCGAPFSFLLPFISSSLRATLTYDPQGLLLPLIFFYSVYFQLDQTEREGKPTEYLNLNFEDLEVSIWDSKNMLQLKNIIVVNTIFHELLSSRQRNKYNFKFFLKLKPVPGSLLVNAGSHRIQHLK